jgi:hypothetical protein
MTKNRKSIKAQEEVANLQPMSITELQPIVEEFMKKLSTIKQEQETLKEDEKALLEEYSDRLDIKTLKLAMRSVDLIAKVERKETFDLFVETLERAI